MAVDLAALVDFVRAETSPPGTTDSFNASEEAWVMALRNAFWTAKLAGLFGQYKDVEGSIQPIPPATADMPREQQQIIVLYAAYNAVRNRLVNISTRTRSRSGPVETERERSATLLTAVLKDLQARLDAMLEQQRTKTPTAIAVFDAVWQRDAGLLSGEGAWVN